MEAKGPLPCSLDASTVPCHEPDESNPHRLSSLEMEYNFLSLPKICEVLLPGSCPSE